MYRNENCFLNKTFVKKVFLKNSGFSLMFYLTSCFLMCMRKVLKSEDDSEYIPENKIYRTASIRPPSGGFPEVIIPDQEKANSMLCNPFTWGGIIKLAESGRIKREDAEKLADEGCMCKMLLYELMKIKNPAITAICEELISKSQATYQTLVSIINYIESRLDESEKLHKQDVEYIIQLKTKLRRSKKYMGRYRKKYSALRIKYKELTTKIDTLIRDKKAIMEQLKRAKERRTTQREGAIKTFIEMHMNVVKERERVGKFNIRYPEELYPYYILLSFAGEFWYNILQKVLFLPTFRTIQTRRQAMLKQYNLTKECFDGSVESIKLLRSKLWDETYDDNRCVLAIDAASLNPQVSIDLTGKVTGMTDDFPNNLTPEDALLLRTNHEAYKEFIKENKKYISKYEFVVLLCPLDERQMNIPIAYVEASSGTATQEMRELLDELNKNACDSGFEVIGYAFDGDRQYLCYSDELLECLDLVWSDEIFGTLSHLWEGKYCLLYFYDMLHLVKCDRYRKAKDKETCVWPTVEEATIHKSRYTEFNEMIKEKYGRDKQSANEHIIPEWLLNDSQEMKMHDDIPLKFFVPQYCHDLFEMKQYDLLLSILPSTYLIEAVMNETLTRDQRIQYLTIGFCIMVLFYYAVRDNKDENQKSDNIGNHPFTLFNEDFAKKYIVLAWSLVHPVADGRCVQLGALGTHFLEHFFGKNRRVNNGDDSNRNFERTVHFHILSSILQKDLNLKISQPKRLSSSGARINKDSELFEIPLIDGMTIAYNFIKLTGVDNIGCDIGEALILSTGIEYSLEDLKNLLPILKTRRTLIPTLKSEGASHVGGLSNMQRYASHAEIDHL